MLEILCTVFSYDDLLLEGNGTYISQAIKLDMLELLML